MKLTAAGHLAPDGVVPRLSPEPGEVPSAEERDLQHGVGGERPARDRRTSRPGVPPSTDDSR